MASQQGSFSVISTYVEMIPYLIEETILKTRDLHVCGDDPWSSWTLPAANL